MAMMYTQADIARALLEAGALPGDPDSDEDYERAFSRVRTWRNRGKLPDHDAERPDGTLLWNARHVDDLADRLAKA